MKVLQPPVLPKLTLKSVIEGECFRFNTGKGVYIRVMPMTTMVIPKYGMPVVRLDNGFLTMPSEDEEVTLLNAYVKVDGDAS
jgi:hypothetical protein